MNNTIKDLDPKNVCNDMLARLQSQVPNTPLSGEPAVPAVSLKELEEKFKELQKKVETKLTEETKSKTDKEAAEEVANYLQSIVDRFNDDITKWYEKTGCVANFSWTYSGGKKLEIAAIDYIVYRKAPPSEKTLKEVLSVQTK